ncbi:hypothetical protein [Luteolibacter sp. LG18]|uniref:hypothetical protein n=1 Tax=Luteolibacter sp. LG18 TaxID=2819286 RepID=UPI002B2D7BBD|nr:hypothetical protein llg_34890 [Luteolibacter sp. LG18]
MLSNTQTPNPSQTVERIREIIVGRQLDRLEQRVALLEKQPQAVVGHSETRIGGIEARVEALQHHFQRLSEGLRLEAETRETRHEEDVQRLSEHIQQTLAARIVPDRGAQLESKLGQWLTDWQQSAHQQAEARDRQLTALLQDELIRLREWVTTQLSSLQQQHGERAGLEQRFAQIAKAARALAEAAEPGSLPGNLPPLP